MQLRSLNISKGFVDQLHDVQTQIRSLVDDDNKQSNMFFFEFSLHANKPNDPSVTEN